MSDFKESDLQRLFRSLPPDPPPLTLYEGVERRARAAAHMRRAAAGAGAVLVVVGLAITASRHGFGGRPSAPGMASASDLATCGAVPASDGPLASKVSVVIHASAQAKSGTRLDAQVVIGPRGGSSVLVNTSNVVRLLITKNGTVVGRDLGPTTGVGVTQTVTPEAPLRLSASVRLAGCESEAAASPLSDAVDLSRKPLPAGDYGLVAVVEDDTTDEGSGAVAVSAPVIVEITASSAESTSSPAT